MTDLHELSVTRHVAAPPAALFRCWTDPSLLIRWFGLPGWEAVRADLDVRPGGASLIVMRGADGAEMHNRDQYLEVVPDRRLVLTDAYLGDWVPSDQPFMTIVITCDPDDDGTRYTFAVRHWSAEHRDMHAGMGFADTWAANTDRLAALAATL